MIRSLLYVCTCLDVVVPWTWSRCARQQICLPSAATLLLQLVILLAAVCLQDHLTGKQYLGWKKIRETYADMVKTREERFRGPPREERDRDRPRSHSRGGELDPRERERDPRERERDPRDRERGSSREYRDRERDRDSAAAPRGRDFDVPPRGRDLDGPPRGDRYRDRDYDRRDFERREMERRERERHGSSRDRERSPPRRDSRRYNEVPPPGKYEVSC